MWIQSVSHNRLPIVSPKIIRCQSSIMLRSARKPLNVSIVHAGHNGISTCWNDQQNRAPNVRDLISLPCKKGERHCGRGRFCAGATNERNGHDNGARLVSQNKSITKSRLIFPGERIRIPWLDRLAAVHFDVLINNAGSGLYGRFEKNTLSTIRV